MQRDRLIQNSPPSFELKVPISVLLLQPWLGHRDPPRYRGTGTPTGTGVPQEQSQCWGCLVIAEGRWGQQLVALWFFPQGR